jgi:hypothetical protein
MDASGTSALPITACPQPLCATGVAVFGPSPRELKLWQFEVLYI